MTYSVPPNGIMVEIARKVNAVRCEGRTPVVIVLGWKEYGEVMTCVRIPDPSKIRFIYDVPVEMAGRESECYVLAREKA